VEQERRKGSAALSSTQRHIRAALRESDQWLGTTVRITIRLAGHEVSMRRGFTLIELLVAIAIIAMLVAVLLPALGLARRTAKATTCAGNLRGIGQALSMYSDSNKDIVVPSYSMTGTSGIGVPLEGWGPILDRDAYMAGAAGQALRKSPFACPEAKDVPGLLTGQTGNDPDNPQGWMDWPCSRDGVGFSVFTIPERGFEKIIRVAYWINANNPIGASAKVVPDLFYTSSVGYGPGSNDLLLTYTRTSAFVRPVTLISVADGVYAGRQRDNRRGSKDCRIGYRHPAMKGSANAVFVDGHVAQMAGDKFPRASASTADLAQLREENWYGQPTVYANPEIALR